MTARGVAPASSTRVDDVTSPLVSSRPSSGPWRGRSSSVGVVTTVLVVLAALALVSGSAPDAASLPVSSLGGVGDGSLRLPTFIGSNMVLQRAPASAQVWGWATPGLLVTVDVARPDGSVLTSASARAAADGSWLVSLPPQPAASGLELRAHTPAASLTARNVAFGEVWLCSGQSNMQFTVAGAFDADAAVADSRRFPDVRLASVKLKSAATPQQDVSSYATKGAYASSAWAVSSPEAFYPSGAAQPDPSAPWGGGEEMGWFSAACYFHGLETYRRLGGKVPVGLVSAAWGGQPIETFASPNALADKTCGGAATAATGEEEADAEEAAAGAEEEAAAREVARVIVRPASAPINLGADETWNPNPGPSEIWNGMIHPLLRMRVAGVAWDQGESNFNRAREYACLFPAMIADWRAQMFAPDLPFVFVQLAAIQRADFVQLRAAQAKTESATRRAAMVTAVDLGDPYSPWDSVHPRRKREVGRRIALAGMRLIFGDSKGLHHRGPRFLPVAPTPTSFDGDENVVDAVRLALASDNGGAARGTLHASATAGCDETGTRLCCGESPFEIKTGSNPTWRRAEYRVDEWGGVAGEGSIAVRTYGETVTGVRYAWERYPQCALYNGEGSHPEFEDAIAAAPFCFDVEANAPCEPVDIPASNIVWL